MDDDVESTGGEVEEVESNTEGEEAGATEEEVAEAQDNVDDVEAVDDMEDSADEEEDEEEDIDSLERDEDQDDSEGEDEPADETEEDIDSLSTSEETDSSDEEETEEDETQEENVDEIEKNSEQDDVPDEDASPEDEDLEDMENSEGDSESEEVEEEKDPEAEESVDESVEEEPAEDEASESKEDSEVNENSEEDAEAKESEEEKDSESDEAVDEPVEEEATEEDKPEELVESEGNDEDDKPVETEESDDGDKTTETADEEVKSPSEIQDGINNYYSDCAEIGKNPDMTPSEKVDAMQEKFESLGDGNRGDAQCIASEEYLDSKEPFKDDGRVNVDYPDHQGFNMEDGKAPEAISRDNPMQESVDRYGSAGGNFVAGMEDGKPASFESRALPNVENPDSYHSYDVDNSRYCDAIDMVRNCDPDNTQPTIDSINGMIDDINKEQGLDLDYIDSDDMKGMMAHYNEYQNSLSHDIPEISIDDAPYGLSGEAAPWDT